MLATWHGWWSGICIACCWPCCPSSSSVRNTSKTFSAPSGASRIRLCLGENWGFLEQLPWWLCLPSLSTQIHIPLQCHLEVILGCRGGEGCWFFLHHVSLSHPCAVSQPSLPQVLGGSQTVFPPGVLGPVQVACGVSLWLDGILPCRAHRICWNIWR